MARNEHKKVLQQLSEAYQTVQERYVMRDPDGDGSWPDDEREEEREKDPNYGEPEYQDTDGEYGEDEELHPATRAAEEIIGSLVTWEPDSGAPLPGAPPEAISRRPDGLMKGEVVDVDVEKGTVRVQTGFGQPGEEYVVEIGELTKVTPRAPREDEYDQERKDNIEYSKRYESEDAEDDAGLWRDQMKHQPDVSPEEVERLKNRKPKPQSYSKKHPKSEKDEYHPGYGKSEGEEDDLHPATRAGEEIVGSDVIWDNHQMKGIITKVDVELGMAIVTDHKGEPHIVELGAFDAVLDPNTETPEEFKHLY